MITEKFKYMIAIVALIVALLLLFLGEWMLYTEVKDVRQLKLSALLRYATPTVEVSPMVATQATQMKAMSPTPTKVMPIKKK